MPVYRNDYKDPGIGIPITNLAELHFYTPVQEYDHNFSAGKVRELRCTGLLIVPFVPSLHATKLYQLFNLYPDVNKYRTQQMKTPLELLQYIEERRRQPDRCLWAVFYDDPECMDYPGPLNDCMMGLIGLYGFDPSTSSIELGPLIIFPPYQRMQFAANAIITLQDYAFTQLLIARLYADVPIENLPCLKLGEKLGFQKELITRGCIEHSAPSEKVLQPGQDPREIMHNNSTVTAALWWDEWYGKKPQSVAWEIRSHVTLPGRYLNGCEKGVVDAAKEFENGVVKVVGNGVNGGRVEKGYDFNFFGEVRELRSRRVVLVPFIPYLYFGKLLELLQSNPDAVNAINFDEAVRGNADGLEVSVEGLMEYLEKRRKDPNACTWAIFTTHEGSETREIPPLEDMAGFVVLDGDKRNELCSFVGPLVIFPAFQRQRLATHTLALLLHYTFSPRVPKRPTSKPGLEHVRVSCRADPQNEAFQNLAKNVHFRKDGITRFCLADNAKRLANISRENTVDCRSKLVAREEWIGSITWRDWEREQKAAMAAGVQKV